MRFVNAEAVRAGLPWGKLERALEQMFREGCVAPLRHRHALSQPGGADGMLLLMPAWSEAAAPDGIGRGSAAPDGIGRGSAAPDGIRRGSAAGPRYTGVKIVHVTPGNGARGLPAVQAVYLLSDGETGQPIALLDGGELTDRRTAAASTLAGRFLARPDSKRLLVLGAGRVAGALAEAWADRFALDQVAIWSRRGEQSAALVARLRAHGVPAVVAPSADPRGFDVVSAATLSEVPLIRGAEVDPGTHIDLVGAFRPTMRESDSALIARATLVVDTRAGGLAEAGDVVQAIAEGAITEAHLAAELADLCRGAHPGRTSASEVTLFKSVGWAGEDLAAAMLAVGAG